jgi:hypothetical protein
VKIWFAGMNGPYQWGTTNRAIEVGDGKRCLRATDGWVGLDAAARSARAR